MFIEFSVKNFLSFKNKVTLSMEKGNGDENLDNINYILPGDSDVSFNIKYSLNEPINIAIIPNI